MKKSLKKSRKPLGSIFRHTLNKVSPNAEKLILEALTNIKKTVPEPLKKTAREISQEAFNAQQFNPLDKYDIFDKKIQLPLLFSVDQKIRPIFQTNNQMLYPHQLDKQTLSKVLPIIKVNQAALSKVSPIFQEPIKQVQQTHLNGGSIGYLKSKSRSRFTIFKKSRRSYF